MLWLPKFRFHFHNSSTFLPVPSQLHPVRIPFNIVLVCLLNVPLATDGRTDVVRHREGGKGQFVLLITETRDSGSV